MKDEEERSLGPVSDFGRSQGLEITKYTNAVSGSGRHLHALVQAVNELGN
jgi:hypothetical protein